MLQMTIILTTRLHSSRMHTARLLLVSPSMHCTGRGVWSWGESVPGGCLLLGGVCSWGGVCTQWGVCSQGGTEVDPPVNRMTDRCKNIPCPKLHLQAVIMTTATADHKQVDISSFWLEAEWARSDKFLKSVYILIRTAMFFDKLKIFWHLSFIK